MLADLYQRVTFDVGSVREKHRKSDRALNLEGIFFWWKRDILRTPRRSFERQLSWIKSRNDPHHFESLSSNPEKWHKCCKEDVGEETKAPEPWDQTSNPSFHWNHWNHADNFCQHVWKGYAHLFWDSIFAPPNHCCHGNSASGFPGSEINSRTLWRPQPQWPPIEWWCQCPAQRLFVACSISPAPCVSVSISLILNWNTSWYNCQLHAFLPSEIRSKLPLPKHPLGSFAWNSNRSLTLAVLCPPEVTRTTWRTALQMLEVNIRWI